MRNCCRSAVSSRGVELWAGWQAGLLTRLWRYFGLARIYAPEEQLYPSSMKSLICRETPRGKAISLEPAQLGIYNRSARERLSHCLAGATEAAAGGSPRSPPRNTLCGAHAPTGGCPGPQQPPPKTP